MWANLKKSVLFTGKQTGTNECYQLANWSKKIERIYCFWSISHINSVATRHEYGLTHCFSDAIDQAAATLISYAKLWNVCDIPKAIEPTFWYCSKGSH